MFSDVISTFYGLVPTNNTIAGVTIIPSDFKGTATAPFARLGIVFSPTTLIATNGSKELRGLLKISIFAKSGRGELYFAEVAAELDALFQNKQFDNYIQTYTSSLQFLGADQKDSTLSRADYTVSFSYYGE